MKFFLFSLLSLIPKMEALLFLQAHGSAKLQRLIFKLQTSFDGGLRFVIEEPELACDWPLSDASRFKQAEAIVTAGLRRLTLWRPSTAWPPAWA